MAARSAPVAAEPAARASGRRLPPAAAAPESPAEREARDLAREFHDGPSLAAAGAEAGGGGGRALAPAMRRSFEARLGFDFSNVRIHDDAPAGRDADRAGAAAFTEGARVSFAAGAYDPWSARGRALLAHELVHVAQLGQAPPLAGFDQRVKVQAPGGLLYRDVAVNPDRVAAELHDAMAGWGTDEEAVYRALQRLGREPGAIRRVEDSYQRQFGEGLEAAIRDDFSGEELEFALQLMGRGNAASAQHVDAMAPSTPQQMTRAAARLQAAFAGWGTDEEAIFAVLLPFERDRRLIDQLRAAYRQISNGESLDERLDDELSWSERDYALYLMGGAPMRARLEVEVIPEAEARELFRELAGLSFWTTDNREAPVPYHYPPDGCYFRAQAMAERMTELGYASEKVFAITSNQLRVRNATYGRDASMGGPDVVWGYHVAPIVQLRTTDGRVIEAVMDPSLESQPVPLADWLRRMSPNSFSRMGLSELEDFSSYTLRGQGSVITSRDIYDPGRAGSGPSGGDAESAHGALERDRPRLTDYSRLAVLHEIAAVIRDQLARPTVDIAPIIHAIQIAPRSPTAVRPLPARHDLWIWFPELRTRLAARLGAPDMAAIDAEVTRP
jgi:hypothetical protein